jgi:hypothetical protein
MLTATTKKIITFNVTNFEIVAVTIMLNSNVNQLIKMQSNIMSKNYFITYNLKLLLNRKFFC